MSSRDLDTLNELLSADHDKIRVLLDEFLNAVHADNWERSDQLFRELEELTERHLGFEEDKVFPVFDSFPELSPHQQSSTAVMRSQHRDIREALGEMGIGLQLHQLREESLQNLAHVILTHATDEDAWAQAILQRLETHPIKQSLMSRLRELLGRDG